MRGFGAVLWKPPQLLRGRQGREKMRPSRSALAPPLASSSIIPFPLFVPESEYEYRAPSHSVRSARTMMISIFLSCIEAQILSRCRESLCDLMRRVTMRGSKSQSVKSVRARFARSLLTHTVRREGAGLIAASHAGPGGQDGWIGVGGGRTRDEAKGGRPGNYYPLFRVSRASEGAAFRT